MRLNETVIAKKQFSKGISNDETLTVTLMLHSLGGQKPYISIIGNIYPRGASGCIHDEISKHFPELSCWLPLHLSTWDGIPMHAYENALYHAGFYADEFKDAVAKPEALANHLRISLEEAKSLCFDFENILTVTKTEQKDKMKAFVEAQKTRWKEEADRFIAFLKN